eukprot:COSAG01_NODE_59531_length_299_cov_18.525000_1_plen_37_part_01
MPRLMHADPRAANVGCQHAPLVHVGLHAQLRYLGCQY